MLARIADAMPLMAAFNQRIEMAAMARLLARGLGMISGVTPSDASQVLGRQSTWDTAAAEKALRLMGRRRGGRFRLTPAHDFYTGPHQWRGSSVG